MNVTTDRVEILVCGLIGGAWIWKLPDLLALHGRLPGWILYSVLILSGALATILLFRLYRLALRRATLEELHTAAADTSVTMERNNELHSIEVEVLKIRQELNRDMQKTIELAASLKHLQCANFKGIENGNDVQGIVIQGKRAPQ